MKTVLYECRSQVVASGTGIATYAHTLAQVAREIGYRAEALADVLTPIDGADPLLAEILMSNAEVLANRRTPGRILRELLDEVVGAPFGVRPVSLKRTGIVVANGSDPFAGFSTIHAVRRLFNVAHAHFLRYRRALRVTLENAPSLFHATHPTPIRVNGCPNLYTVHDIVPMRLPYATLDNKRNFMRIVSHLAATADHIVTVSEYSRKELLQFFKMDEGRITNTYQGITFPPESLARSDDEVADEVDTLFQVAKGEYFLFYGALEPKKNVSRLIDAYAASRTQRPLLIAGGLGWQYASDLEKIEDERFRVWRIDGNTITMERRVRRLPYVPRDQLISLIRGARAVLFPSIYEGFGLPVLEAMQLGTPVMTSNVASLPEVAGDAALLVDPYDVADMARAIRTLDKDEALCRELACRGLRRAELFSPAQYATRIAELYRRLV
jgi:glycosyltransferase involved in cell wall biosynthesis